MIEVEFIQDYATKKKGEKAKYDSQLSASLIGKGVAKIPSVKRAKKK